MAILLPGRNAASLIGFSLSLFGAGCPALAQDNAVIIGDIMMQEAVGSAMMSAARAGARKSASPNNFVPQQANASKVDLNFKVSPSRRRSNYARFVEKSRRADSAGAANLEATLRSDPIAAMTAQLASYGLRTDNVADAYSVYWVEAWQAVHGVTGDSSRTTAQAVREQAANAIRTTPEFAGATDAQKQEFADALLIQALLVGAAREQAQGDRAQLAKVAAAVEQGARATGLDLRAMTLTEAGFVAAKKTGAADPTTGATTKALAANDDAGLQPGYGFLTAAGGAGVSAAFLMGKTLGRKG